MKLTVKRSLGKLTQIRASVTPALKQRLDSLRVRAEDRNIDYTATLMATLEDFATELTTVMESDSSQSVKLPGGTPSK
jgi:hypothetical protein